MSSKNSISKVDPIKLDTTMLKINIKTNGDLLTKEYDLIPFHPNMADMVDLSNNNYILFPAFVKITMNYLKKAGVGQDYKKVFTNLEKYIQLIKFVTKPNKEIDEDFTLLVDQTQFKNYSMSFVQDFTSDVTNDFRAVQKYEPLTSDEIITNNIGLIKSIFLPQNGRFFVLGHEYIINESKYLPKYKASESYIPELTEQKKIPLNYTIEVELQLLDVAKNPGMGDFSKLSCKQKKKNLTKDFKEIFGDSFGYIEEDPKAVLPPLTPATFSKRGFGKLQLEWEDRNKYVKPPTTEKERQDIEKNWSPLQRKMSQLDKFQEDYNKIPPLWIKERKELEDKYENFAKEMKGYKDEIAEIKRVNNAADEDNSLVKDLTDDVREKMKKAIATLNESMDETAVNKIVEELEEKTPYDIKTNAPFKEKYETEKKQIDLKYVEPFLVDLKERQKDVTALTSEYEKLKKEVEVDLEKNSYNISVKKQELGKVQAALLKKKTDYKLLEDKYGKEGEKLIQKWNEARSKMDGLKKNIETDRNIGEQKILNESVTKELDTKLKEIKALKKTLYKAYYFAGQYAEITKKEGSEYSKKPGERPIETVKDLKESIDRIETEYLDIAGKLGSFNKLQSYITLLNEDASRIKYLKENKITEKNEKDKELKSVTSNLLTAKRINDQSKTDANNTGAKPEDANIKSLEAEQAKLQTKIKPLIQKVDLLTAYEKKYNEAIAELRKKNNPNITNEEYKMTYDEKQNKFKAYNEKYITAIGNIDTDTFTDSVANVFTETSGGGKTLRKRTLRRQSKSKSKTHKKNKRRRVHTKTTHKRLHNASLKKRRLRHRQRQRHRQEKKYTRRR